MVCKIYLKKIVTKKGEYLSLGPESLMMSLKLPSRSQGGQPLRLVPGSSLTGSGDTETSSIDTSSNSESELSGGQDREGD